MDRFRMIVHIIPRSVFANTYQGSYKDTISRVRFLEGAGVDYRQVRVDADDPDSVLGALEGMDCAPRVLVEYSHYPLILQALRRRWPRAFIAVRAHNIEPLQHLDNHGWWPKRGPFWVLYGMWRLLLQDIRCKRLADVILSISDWENRVYWERLPGRVRAECLPYVCPEHLAPREPLPFEQRRLIACLPTSQRNRKSWDLVTRFIRFAEAMRAAGADYDFVITGDLGSWRLPPSTAVTYAGFVDDLPSFLGRCRAVAMLSPLGYGFKTTIGDALAAGARVIAHPRLLRRCPTAMQGHLLSLDTDNGEPVPACLAALRSPPAATALHGELRERNHRLLASLFPG
jgi:hypothetical protein